MLFRSLENKLSNCHREGQLPILSKKDVAMMMVLLKVAREQKAHKRDNLVDAVGYIRNAAQIEGLE